MNVARALVSTLMLAAVLPACDPPVPYCAEEALLIPHEQRERRWIDCDRTASVGVQELASGVLLTCTCPKKTEVK